MKIVYIFLWLFSGSIIGEPFQITLTESEGRMKLYELATENFLYSRVTTDMVAFQLLKKNPLDKPIAYLAASWSHFILRISLNAIDQSLKVIREPGFTITQNLAYYKLVPVLKRISNIRIIFTPHAKKNEIIDGVKILPFPFYSMIQVDPAAKKDIYLSFIGFISHPVRKKLLNMRMPRTSVMQERKLWHYYADLETRKKYSEEYNDVLARSRFSLCPRGSGRSTLRFWESLQAGAIPILISDDLALPAGIDWDNCIIRIAEKNIAQIPKVLKSISPDKEKEMRKNCLEAYRLCSDQNLVRCIRIYYDDVP